MNDHTQAVEDDAEALKENAARAKEASAAHQSMLGLIGNVYNENKKFADTQAELTAKMQDNRAEAEKLYPWQLEKLGELDQKYTDMQSTYEENAAAHNAAMGKIQYDLLITRLSVDGLTDAEFNVAQKAGIMFGVFDQESSDAATDMYAVAEAVNTGRLKVEDMQTALDMLAGKQYSVDVVLNALASISSGASAALYQNGNTTKTKQTQQGGFAEGGISTGPASGHMELLHGTEAVIPLQNGSVPVQLQGGSNGGNTNVNVQLTIASPVTILDQQTAQRTLMPFIIQGVREARARGAL
jgi:hypothetical protein